MLPTVEDIVAMPLVALEIELTVLEIVSTLPFTPVITALIEFKVVLNVPTVVVKVATPLLMLVMFALKAVTLVNMYPTFVDNVATLPLTATIVALSVLRVEFILVTVSLMAEITGEVLVSGSASTVNSAVAAGA
jgi:hypothetical protein